MATKEQITIATANTYFGQVVRTPGGLQPLAHADILLLQEVFNPTIPILRVKLEQIGFKLIRATGRSGLVIALRSKSTIRTIDNSVHEYILQPLTKIEKVLAQRFAKQKHEFIERGMLAAKFVTLKGNVFTVATAHIAVAAMPKRRAKQITKISDVLADSYYNGSLVLGGDMNHYPKPNAVDKSFWHRTGLTLVDLNEEPTWYAKGSKQEKYLRIAALMQRKPIENYNGQLDDVLYRGKDIKLVSSSVIDIDSDHRSIITTFRLDPTKK